MKRHYCKAEMEIVILEDAIRTSGEDLEFDWDQDWFSSTQLET